MQPYDQNIKEVIEAWSSPILLSSYAAQRHGFGDSDGGFGVTYPDELDEYDIEVYGDYIPERHVQIYGFWGTGSSNEYEYIVPEKRYLEVLHEFLQEKGLLKNAQEVAVLIKQCT